MRPGATVGSGPMTGILDGMPCRGGGSTPVSAGRRGRAIAQPAPGVTR